MQGGRRAPAAWLIFVLLLRIERGAESQHDFRPFEEMLPRFVELFRVGDGPGQYCYDPSRKEVSVYGSSDMVHLLFTVNSLNVSEDDAHAWSTVINSFQNTTGIYTPYAYEGVCGFVPWHTTGFAAAAVSLLGRAPMYRPEWSEALAAAGPGKWTAALTPLLNGTNCSDCSPGDSIWQFSHKLAAIPATLLMAGDRERFAPFFDWLYGVFLSENLDPKTGMWCARAEWAPPNHVQCLGGAFHVFFVEQFSSHPWALPETVHSTALSMQHAESGLWGSPTRGGLPTFIDLDGVYQVIRSAVQLGNPAQLWAAARGSCDAFLDASALVLNDATTLFSADGFAANSHMIVGAVAGVAECARWFPDLVRTRRAWRQGLDVAPYI